MDGIRKNEFIKGTVWKLFERLAGRGISLIISVILTRLLTPDDYGLIALTTVFTNLSEILIDAGFSTALVQKKEVNAEDYACVFVISSVVSIILYIVLFFSSPIISSFYDEPELTNVLRVMSLVLFIQAFSSTRNAYVNRNMQFKLLMKCNTIAAILSGGVGIAFAYCGFGVWSLVFQRLLQQGILTAMLFMNIRWKLKFRFNMDKLKEMFRFSSGVIGASLVNYFENIVNSLIIGKHYSVAELGYYDKGNILPEQISMNTFGAMTNVLLPTVSSYQNDIKRLKFVIRKVVSYTAYVMFPIMLGMIMISKDLVIVLFTEKWLPSVSLMKCICIYYIATPLMLIDVQVFFGLGHSEIRLKTEVYRMFFILLGLAICCLLFKLPIQYLALSNAITASLGAFLTHIEVKKVIGYSIIERIKDTYKSILSTLMMCLVLYIINDFIDSIMAYAIAKLLFKILVGVGVYVFLSIFLKNDVFLDILLYLKQSMKEFKQSKGE